MDREHIISAIEAHAAAIGLAPATITSRAVGNSRLYDRMKAGGDCTTKIGRRIMDFIHATSAAAAAPECDQPQPPTEDAA